MNVPTIYSSTISAVDWICCVVIFLLTSLYLSDFLAHVVYVETLLESEHHHICSFPLICENRRREKIKILER